MSRQGRERPYARLVKGALAVGYIALAGGIVAAYRAPATGYELSMYAATPSAYVAGVALALAVGVPLSFLVTESRPVRQGAHALAGLAVLSVVVLPLVRGYYLYAGGDSLTHLGWTRDILAGQFGPMDLLYPGLHTTTVLVSRLVGIRPGLSQLFVAVAVVLVYVVFVALCVRYLGRRRWALPVGVCSALLLLPINNISTHVEAHPVTLSVLLLPLVLYLLLRYTVRDGAPAGSLGLATPTGALLALTGIAVVFVHPQGALNVVAILLAVTAVQWLARGVGAGDGIAGHRSAVTHAVVVAAVFLLWAPRFDRVRGATEGVVSGLLGGAAPADEITQRSTSLAAVGGSVPELFVKLFLVAALFCVLAGLVSLALFAGRLSDRYPERNALVTYLVVAAVPLFGGFGLFFLASSNTMHFRYLGFLMVPATVLGALALSGGMAWLTGGDSGRGRLALVVVFLLLLPLPVATVHSTPFIYKPTSDLTAMHYHGANETFERMDRDVPFAGIRSGPGRLLDGTRGTNATTTAGIPGLDERGAIPYRVFGRNLTSYYEDRRYIPVSAADYQREVVLYDELRYSRRGFTRLDASPVIDRVGTTGEYRLYLLGNETRR